MMTAYKQEAPGARQRFEGRIKNTCASHSNPDPFEGLLARLEGVQRHGKGARALCPACGGRSRKLSLTQGDDGRVLLNCFGGCPAHDVLAAVGLTVGNLFVRRDFRTMTPAERSQFQQAAMLPKWRAALEVLSLEASVLLIAGNQLADNQPLSDDDLIRVRAACLRIFDTKEVLDAR